MPLSHTAHRPLIVPLSLGAAWRALESMEPRALFTDAFAGALAGTEAVREALSLARAYLSPGSAQHVEQRRFCFSNVASRVWWFDRQLEAALGASAGGASSRPPRQVVVLGAGMDSRPWRMELPPGVRWLEADLPSVASAKREQLAQLGAGFEPGQTCSHPLRAASWAILPADLSQPGWTKALVEAGLDCTQPIVWVAEGLLMYLKNDQVTALLREMAGELAGALRQQPTRRAGKVATAAGVAWVCSCDRPVLLSPSCVSSAAPSPHLPCRRVAQWQQPDPAPNDRRAADSDAAGARRRPSLRPIPA